MPPLIEIENLPMFVVVWLEVPWPFVTWPKVIVAAAELESRP